MDVACQDCGHKFFLPGELLPTMAGGGCENCGSPNVYRQQPTPLHSEMSERNMPVDGRHPDTGGNPLQEGILADDGWEPLNKRDESFASVKLAVGDMVFDFGSPDMGPQPTHTVVVTKDGRVHSAQGKVPHEQIADTYGLHQTGFPYGSSLGYVNDDGSSSWFQHDSGHTPEALANAVSGHLASNYGLHVPVTVDPNMKPTTNDERWFGDNDQYSLREQRPYQPDEWAAMQSREPNASKPRPFNYYDNPFINRGGSVNDTLSIEPYDSFFHQADVPDAAFNSPGVGPAGQYSAEVTPGPHGIHAGTVHWLKFFDAAVNGKPARTHGPEIFQEHGDPSAPTFRQPVTVSAHHPEHLPAVVEAVEQSADGARPTPMIQQVGQAIQAGQAPWPPGMGPENVRQGHIKTAAPLAFIPEAAEAIGVGAAAEGAGAGAAAAGAGEAGGIGVGSQLMKGALLGTGSHMAQGLLGGGEGGAGGGAAPYAPPVQVGVPGPPVSSYTGATHEADIPGKIDTPDSVGRMPVETDPERVDPHELNDGEQDKSLIQHTDAEGGGSQAPAALDPQDAAEFQRLLPKILEYYHSPDSAANDPEIRALHERLYTRNPDYLNHGDENGAQQYLDQLRQPPGITAGKKISFEGSRVVLADMTLDDEDRFMRFAHENVDFHEPYAPLPKHGDVFALHLKSSRRLLAVNDRKTGDLVGFYTLHQDGTDAEIGVAADQRFARNGYMNEAGDLLLKAAKNLGIKRFIAKTDPENKKTISFLKKRGYKHQGGDLWTKWLEPLDDPVVRDPSRLSVWTTAAPMGPMNAPGAQSYGVQPSTGAPMAAPLLPGGQQPGMGMAPQQGRCQYCGGTTTADGSCPQCGASQNPMGGQIPGQPGGAGMPNVSTPPVAVASVREADAPTDQHAGPVTPEQQAAVADLLVAEGRAEEVATMVEQPHLYARELARIQNNPDTPPPPVDPQDVTPPPAQEVAPPGATMPVPDPSQQIAAAVAKFAADSYAPRCPECGSATTGYQNAKGECFCHSCRNTWNPENLVERKLGAPQVDDAAPNVEGVPAAEQDVARDVEQEQDSSLTWSDTGGQPLQTGQEYYIHTPKYQIPDLVQVVTVKPDSIVLKAVGEVVNPLQEDSDSMGYQYEISKQEADIDQLTFEPAGDESATPDFSDVRNNVQDVTGPNTEPQAPRTQTSSLNAEVEPETFRCPECSSTRISSNMSSPTTMMHDCYRCAHVWETEEELEQHESGLDLEWVMGDSTPWDEGFAPPRFARSVSSRSLSEIADKDDFYKQRKALLDERKVEREQRLAGAKFTPREKREFIDEDGTARNSDLLDLSGTHYESSYRTRDDGYGRGDLVPDEHLVLGL